MQVPTQRLNNTKKKNKLSYEPAWHKVLGVPSVRGIAKQLQRLAEYNIYYSKGSRVVHSSSFKDQLQFTSTGAHLPPIRYVAEVGTVLNYAFTSAMLVFNRVLGFYRGEELGNFALRYINEWRSAFICIPSIKVVDRK